MGILRDRLDCKGLNQADISTVSCSKHKVSNLMDKMETKVHSKTPTARFKHLDDSDDMSLFKVEIPLGAWEAVFTQPRVYSTT